MKPEEPLDVVFLCEGTYPFISGGVSSWIHGLLEAMPDVKFGLVFLCPSRATERKLKFKVPDNLRVMTEVFLYDVLPQPIGHQETRGLQAQQGWAAAERLWNGILEGYAPNFAEDALDMLRCLTLYDLAWSRGSWDLLVKLYNRRAPDLPFPDFFWNWRFMSFPLYSLLHAPLPPAKVYHTVTTGWSGLLGTLAHLRTGRPLVLTEHGIYTHERRIEIVRADWIYVERGKGREARDFGVLKSMWIHLFSALGRLCYDHSERIYTLYEGNRRMQVAAGAVRDRVELLANGVKLDLFKAPEHVERFPHFSVGFVGRVVPIKDVKTLIQACRLLQTEVPEAVTYVIGPTEEDEDYFEECQALARTLGVEENIKFLGPQNVREWYPKLDVLVLTSVSEGQPLVILEGFCYNVPCVTTDVGACSELISGREGEDAALGPAGFVTRVGVPGETAAALARLARDPELRGRMGRAGRERAHRYYDQRELVRSYLDVYQTLGRQEDRFGGHRV